jgi:D-alanyl-D-alanine dipeptidase
MKLILIFLLGCSSMKPNEFVKLSEFCPDVVLQMDYATMDNFTGLKVAGYNKVEAYLTKRAALALCEVNTLAMKTGMRLKIFDAYRPIKAVQFFKDWAQIPENNLELKKKYYPGFSRIQLFEQGYIAEKSSHSRGGTVDLTLVDAVGAELDMGGIFDYFHEVSGTNYDKISSLQKQNRKLLLDLMTNAGFRNYDKEWWHFTFTDEVFPNTAFDFDVE